MTVINSIGNTNILLGQSIVDLKNQLDTLQTQLATGRKSTVYSGIGINEGFAIFARSQISNLTAFSTTMTNINTTIDTTNTALTSFGQIATQVKSAAGSLGAIVTGSGQTVGQQTASLQLKSMLEILNTQAGDRFLLCTDGLCGLITDDQLANFIKDKTDMQQCADGLCQLALDGGSRDNISCVMVEVVETT